MTFVVLGFFEVFNFLIGVFGQKPICNRVKNSYLYQKIIIRIQVIFPCPLEVNITVYPSFLVLIIVSGESRNKCGEILQFQSVCLKMNE